MKKLPGYLYVLIGAAVAVVGLYFWGKASMKKESGTAGAATNTGTTAPGTETKKSLAGGVLRSNN
jgi:hypothetical protein